MKNRHERGKRKAARKTSPRPAAKGNHVAPRTADEYFAKSERFQDRWKRGTHVISKMRADGTSLSQASREFDLDPRTVQRLAPSALRKLRTGRWEAKHFDRLLRVLVIPTRKGLREIGVRDSRQASQLGKYSTAVERYLQTGDASALRDFQGKHILDASGKRVPLLTDLRALDRLGSAGVLSFESLYARAA
jgi:hypothetical protein